MATKKYICAFCARAFTRSEHKQRHERSHTNEKPFHCLHCTSSFVRRDLLQRHCRTVHNFQLNASQIQQVKQDASQQQQNSEQQQLQIQSQHYPQQLYGERLQVDESQLRVENSNEIPSTSDASSNNNSSQIINPDTGPPPKRKKSTDANAEPLINHDLIHLLSITRKLETLLGSFDPSNIEYQLNDYFLIGYVNLLSSEVDYKIFDRLLKDLFQYLNSFNVSNNHPLPQHGDYESGLHDFSAGKKKNEISNFKIGILYAIISLGYCCNDKHKLAIKFFLQSWNLLVRKLIPNYNNNNNVLDQIEILNNLYLLSYIFLEFDYGKFDSEEFEEEGTLINDDIILNYLNDISFIILSNLNTMSCSNDNILDANLSMFWNIYILLSTYLKKNPPKFYSFFINKKVISADSNGTDSERTSLDNGESAILSLVMMKLSKSFISLNRPQTDNEARFLNTIIIATLSNELKSLINGDNFLIYTTGNYLHNAIILINKSINVHDTLTNNPLQVYEGSRHSSLLSVATTSSVSNNDQKHEKAVKLFELFKKNIIINSPLKFHELLNNYLFIPSHFYNWELLSITIQEINMNFPINQYLLAYLLAPNPQSNSLSLNLANYFNPKQNPIEINNNLSIISFPIIFFTKYLSLDIVDLSKYNVLQLNFINVFIVEWYMIMHKVMIMMWNNPSIFDDNYILQNLVYLLLDNKKALSKKLNIDKGSNYGNGQFLDAGKDEEFLFNHKWFWILKLKFDLIYESWMNLIKNEITNKCKIDGKTATNISGSYPVKNNCTSSTYRYSVNNLSLLKANVNKFINDLIQNDMPKFIQEERFAAGPPGSLYGVNSYGPPLNNADASATAAAATVATMQYTNNNGISQNPMFMNYSNSYNVLNSDFDHMMGNNSYRRANSITLGLLANANNVDQTNNISPAMSNSSLASSSSNRSVMKNLTGANMKPDTNYHSKPINPPPILSSSGTPANIGGPSEVPVLPSILRGRNFNSAYSNEYSSGPNDLKSKEVDRNVKITPDLKPMIPGVVRKH